MFATVPTSYFEFDDIYRGTKVTLTARSQHEGFMMDEDVRLGVPAAKRPNERIGVREAAPPTAWTERRLA